MEIVAPWFIYVGVAVVCVLPFLKIKAREAYKKGKKVANAHYTREIPFYKKLWKKYRTYCYLAMGSLLLAIAAGFVLLARPADIRTINPTIHNRDIFMCMDISDSVDELNISICDELRKVVKELDGERFGISIFNGRSVTLVPLTTDYDYVLQTLDKLEASFRASKEVEAEDFVYDFYSDTYQTYYYKHNGTLSDYGSSFIGDGLASCLYSFPDLKENGERSRMIIFTTDNELNGTPIVTVEEAAGYCKKNGVKVFGVVPDDIVDEESFKQAMLSTGGGFYNATKSKSFDNLISDIEQTDASVMEESKTIVTGKPEASFLCLLVCVGLYFLFARKAKL